MQVEIDGVLLVDKPAGLTSAGVVRILKRKLHPKKIGHGGTLDPFATGLLVILLGRATKQSPLFLEGDKTYSGVIRLGVGTDTDDITGQVVATEDVSVRFPESSRGEVIEKLRARFLGEILQTPPTYSALKIGGERSYRLARKGREVKPEPRQVRISELELKFLSPEQLSYRMRCSKGTYVRSLGRDIGTELGTVACVETLCREETSGFRLSEAVELDAVEPECLDKHLISVQMILERTSAGNIPQLGPGPFLIAH